MGKQINLQNNNFLFYKMDKRGRKSTRQPASNRSKTAPARAKFTPPLPPQPALRPVPELPSEMRSKIFRHAREAEASRIPHRAAAAGPPRPMRQAAPGGGVTGASSPLTYRHEGPYARIYYDIMPPGSPFPIQVIDPQRVRPRGRVLEGTPRGPVTRPVPPPPRGRPPAPKKETKKAPRSQSFPRSKPKTKGKKK